METPWASDFPCTEGVDGVWPGDKGQGSQSPPLLEGRTPHSSLGSGYEDAIDLSDQTELRWFKSFRLYPEKEIRR